MCVLNSRHRRMYWSHRFCPALSVEQQPIILKTSKKLKKSSSSADQDLTQATIAQFTGLTAEVLCMHLAFRHLVTTGTKAAMAQWLYGTIHAPQDSSTELQQQNPNPSSTSQQQDGVPASHQRNSKKPTLCCNSKELLPHNNPRCHSRSSPHHQLQQPNSRPSTRRLLQQSPLQSLRDCSISSFARLLIAKQYLLPDQDLLPSLQHQSLAPTTDYLEVTQSRTQHSLPVLLSPHPTPNCSKYSRNHKYSHNHSKCSYNHNRHSHNCSNYSHNCSTTASSTTTATTTAGVATTVAGAATATANTATAATSTANTAAITVPTTACTAATTTAPTTSAIPLHSPATVSASTNPTAATDPQR